MIFLDEKRLNRERLLASESKTCPQNQTRSPPRHSALHTQRRVGSWTPNGTWVISRGHGLPHNSHTRQRGVDSWEPEAKGVTLGLAANHKVIDALALKHTVLSPCALQACGRNLRVGPEGGSGRACSMWGPQYLPCPCTATANFCKGPHPGRSVKAGSFKSTSAQVPALETLIHSVQGAAWAWVFSVKLPEQV